MQKNRPALFRRRHFEDQIIVLCVRWYLSYSLSYRDLEEMMAERNLSVDHSTIARWVLRYGLELSRRVRHEVRHPNRSWRVDETYVRVAGRWDLPLPSGRFLRRHGRLHALTQTRCDSRQTLPSIGSGARWSDPAAGDQRRWASGVPTGNRRFEADRRTGPQLPLSTCALPEQRN